MIIVGSYAVSTVQWVSIVLVGTICTALNRTDVIWPVIGLVISLHFLPLGWVFGVRPYYLMGALWAAGQPLRLSHSQTAQGSSRSGSGLGCSLLPAPPTYSRTLRHWWMQVCAGLQEHRAPGRSISPGSTGCSQRSDLPTTSPRTTPDQNTSATEH
jgi:hypothetical protein